MTALLAIRNWWTAARPRTLIAGASPILIGSALAPHPLGGLALLFALLIQIGTNFANDYGDAIRGADSIRVGPPRAVASGWISAQSMRSAALIAFGLAALCSLPLLVHVGWSFTPLVLISILLGWLYTGGPKPLAYLGLSELPCLLFFGPIPCAGTVYLSTGTWEMEALFKGLGPGLLATALLVANNLRDETTDRAVGKNTLVVRFGRKFGLIEWALCVGGAALIAPPLASLTCLLARPTLPETARTHFLYTCALCFSLLLFPAHS